MHFKFNSFFVFINVLSQDVYVKDNLTRESISGVVFYQKSDSNIVLNQKYSDLDGKTIIKWVY